MLTRCSALVFRLKVFQREERLTILFFWCDREWWRTRQRDSPIWSLWRKNVTQLCWICHLKERLTSAIKSLISKPASLIWPTPFAPKSTSFLMPSCKGLTSILSPTKLDSMCTRTMNSWSNYSDNQSVYRRLWTKHPTESLFVLNWTPPKLFSLLLEIMSRIYFAYNELDIIGRDATKRMALW